MNLLLSSLGYKSETIKTDSEDSFKTSTIIYQGQFCHLSG